MTRDTPRCPIFGPKIWEFSGGPPGPHTPDLIIPRNFGRSNLNYHVIKFFPALPVWPKMALKHIGLGGSPSKFNPQNLTKNFLGLGDHQTHAWKNFQPFCDGTTPSKSLPYPPLYTISKLQKTPIYILISWIAKKH